MGMAIGPACSPTASHFYVRIYSYATVETDANITTGYPYSYRMAGTTTAAYFEPPKRDPKDPRRWFDCFRTPSQACPAVCDLVQVGKCRRPQSRCDHSQRRRHKRKRFVQELMA